MQKKKKKDTIEGNVSSKHTENNLMHIFNSTEPQNAVSPL